MIKTICISLVLFTALFISASSFAIQIPHAYYIINDITGTTDQGVGISDAPTNCTPNLGWVNFNTTQEFLCKGEIGGDEYFEFNADISGEYFTMIRCYKNDFRNINGKATVYLQKCGIVQKK